MVFIIGGILAYVIAGIGKDETDTTIFPIT